ncbi:MAG: Gfo/Idh/MocA family oxidoreductase [Bryobacteraceae bacterium]|jgi:predicted dehydrogenase
MIRWLVVGIGDIAVKRVIPGILSEPRSRLEGLVTRDPAKATPYGVPSWSSIDAALAAVHPDAVYVATPVALHAAQSIAALRAGAHVLCEKPMALNHADASQMVTVAHEIGRTLGIAYYRRMYPKIERARALIEAGAIGRPVFAEATNHYWFYPEDGARAWLIDPKLAGNGPLRDIASHRIDVLAYLFGPARRVTGHLSTLVHPTAVEDNATVLVEYASGMRGMVDVRWHSHVARDEFRIRGTDGELELTPLNGPEIVWPGGREHLPPHANLHYPMVEDFVTAILEGRQPRSSGDTALETERIMDEAARNGKT